MPKVLLVDADADSRDYLARALAGAGYETAAAPNGATALDRLRSAPPDLVVTQGWLGDVDAARLVANSRGVVGAPRVSFLVLAGADEAIGAAAAGAGADRVHAGHISVSGVLREVRELIGPGGDAVAPPSRLAPAAALAPAPPQRPSAAAEFQGSLGVMDLPALAQAISIGVKSGRLALFLPVGDGRVDFERGLPVHAEFGGGTGEAAFAALVWASQAHGGTFRFEPAADGAPPGPHTINRSAERLLLDVAAWLDEDRPGGGPPPGSAARSAQK